MVAAYAIGLLQLYLPVLVLLAHTHVGVRKW